MTSAGVALAVAAGLVAGCGGDSPEPDGREQSVVRGVTETGMKLEVEPLVDPAEDPLLAELDAFREAVGGPPVKYMRVTADNSEGQRADSGRVVRFASDPEALRIEGGIQARFTCDALEFEWLPPPNGRSDLRDTYDELQERLCADGPPKPDGIEPGETQVYYLFVEERLETRGIEEMRVFGPLSVELE